MKRGNGYAKYEDFAVQPFQRLGFGTSVFPYWHVLDFLLANGTIVWIAFKASIISLT
jgi:hypothetical protein